MASYHRLLSFILGSTVLSTGTTALRGWIISWGIQFLKSEGESQPSGEEQLFDTGGDIFLHPNASIRSGTEKEIGSRQRQPNSADQVLLFPCGWRGGFSFLIFLQLLASKGRESTSCFLVLFSKGRGRLSFPPGLQLYNKYGRKLIMDRFNGGVEEQAVKNLMQPYRYRWKICLALLHVSRSGQQEISRELYSPAGSQNSSPSLDKTFLPTETGWLYPNCLLRRVLGAEHSWLLSGRVYTKIWPESVLKLWKSGLKLMSRLYFNFTCVATHCTKHRIQTAEWPTSQHHT